MSADGYSRDFRAAHNPGARPVPRDAPTQTGGLEPTATIATEYPLLGLSSLGK